MLAKVWLYTGHTASLNTNTQAAADPCPYPGAKGSARTCMYSKPNAIVVVVVVVVVGGSLALSRCELPAGEALVVAVAVVVVVVVLMVNLSSTVPVTRAWVCSGGGDERERGGQSCTR